MPARRASGSVGQAATTAASSASSGNRPVAFWVAVWGRIEAFPVACWREHPRPLDEPIPRGMTGLGVSGRFLSQVTGEGLEPSTNGLTYRIGFHRPPPYAFGGVGRCCESGLSLRHRRRAASSLWSRDRRSAGPMPADYPIPRLFGTVTLAVAGDVVVARALRAFQQFAASTRRGSVSSRARPQPIPLDQSPLLYRLSYPVSVGLTALD